MSIEQITITNCGPIQHVSIPFVQGKINVLRGRNGSGKSTVLEHVEQAMTGRGKGNVRDGAASGSVDAFGVTVKLGRSTRRSGELHVESIEGKFNVSDLIDPGVIDGKSADARRIKAFAQIQKVLPSADLFYPLVGGRQQLEKIARPASLNSDDLVVMAERIKADLQDAARKEEDQATHAEGHANGARQATEGVDIRGECDAKALQSALNQAIQQEAQLKADQTAAEKAARAAQLAADQLADAEAEYQGPSIEEAQRAEDGLRDRVQTAEEDVRQLETQLQQARQRAELARTNLSSAIATRKQAESHERSMKAWRDQVAAAVPVAPAPELLEAAAAKVAACNKACDQGALIRKAKEHLADAERHIATASAHRQRAQELRDAAKGTDDVLSDIVARPGSQLRVEQGRLVLDTPRRGKTFFHELSAGERARIAVDIGIDAMPAGRPGAIIVSQEIYEGLDPVNRDALAAHIADCGVGILTAEAGEQEEITPEVYEPATAPADRQRPARR